MFQEAGSYLVTKKYRQPPISCFQSQANDVIIHCKHGEKLRTNKLVLAVGSKFIRSMLAGSQTCCDATSDLVSYSSRLLGLVEALDQLDQLCCLNLQKNGYPL